MKSDEHSNAGRRQSTAGRVFEAALLWSLVSLSILLLLVVVAGTADLLPASLAVACRMTLTYLCAVFTFTALLYTVVDKLRTRVSPLP
jgi:hypothetical protein